MARNSTKNLSKCEGKTERTYFSFIIAVFILEEYNKNRKRRNYNEKIEVYTQPDCPPCVIVKEFLKHNNVAYEEFDVKDAAARNRLLNDYDSYSTPTVVIDGEVVAGFQIEKLQQLLNIE